MSGSYAGYHRITKERDRRAIKNKYSKEKHKRIQEKKINKFHRKRRKNKIGMV